MGELMPDPVYEITRDTLAVRCNALLPNMLPADTFPRATKVVMGRQALRDMIDNGATLPCTPVTVVIPQQECTGIPVLPHFDAQVIIAQQYRE